MQLYMIFVSIRESIVLVYPFFMFCYRIEMKS